MYFEGLGLQNPFKFEDFQFKYRFKIVLHSCCVFGSILVNFWMTCGAIFDRFGSLLASWGGFWIAFGRPLASFGVKFGFLRAVCSPWGPFWWIWLPFCQFGLQNWYKLSSKVKSLSTFEQFETRFRSKVPISICQSQCVKLFSSTDAAVSA